MMRSGLFRKLTALVCLLFLFAITNSLAQAQTLEKLPVAYTVIAPTQATLWTAKELGLFAKHGLDVELVLLVGAPLVVTDEIKQVEDLRGKKFGVSRIGSADNAAAITVFNSLGIKESEVTYVKAGSIPSRLAAMQTNALQATLLQAPETLKAKEIGMRPLLDFTKLDVEWQQNGVATTRDYIKKKPDTVRRFIRAFVEGSHYNLANPKGAQKILQKYLAIKDDKSVQESYNEIVAKLTLKVPYPTEPGLQLYLDQLKIKNPKAAQAKPSDFTDISFLKELESSGFIDKLYK